MKLFSKKRLKETKDGSGIKYSWRSFNMAELLLLFILAATTVYGIASYNGAEELFDRKIISMTQRQTVIYWSVIGVCVLHYAFNRNVSLKISKNELVYKRRLFLGMFRRTPLSEITTMKVKRLLNLAESIDTGMQSDSYVLKIYRKSRRRIIIRGLSQEDCETIQAKIKQYKKSSF